MKGKRHEQAKQDAPQKGSKDRQHVAPPPKKRGAGGSSRREKAARAADVLASLLGGDGAGTKDGGTGEQAATPAGGKRAGKTKRVPADDTSSQKARPDAPPFEARLDVPKKHPDGSLKRGDSVWYRGERYWVEFANTQWSSGSYVRISNEPVHPEPERPLPTDTADPAKPRPLVSFCVHADLLDLAPQNRNIYGRQPSQADIVRHERHANGQRDVGDEVANLLRAASAKGLDGCYAAAADFLGCPESALREKYGHLNPGQQRMNLGNRMRGHAKKRH